MTAFIDSPWDDLKDGRRRLVGETEDVPDSESGVFGEIGDGQLPAGLGCGSAVREPSERLFWAGSSMGEESWKNASQLSMVRVERGLRTNFWDIPCISYTASPPDSTVTGVAAEIVEYCTVSMPVD
jgi:hypothetical protein